MNEFLKGTKIGRIGKKNVFSVSEIPNLEGKIAIVTGSTSGLGKETAIELAKSGATVIIAARKTAPGEPPFEAVLKEIRSKSGAKENKVDFIELDLGSLKKVKAFAEAFKKKYDQLDILVNNAGVSLCPFILSDDKLELHFAINHLGHFLLTNELLDYLKKSESARIVMVSSRHHHDSYPEGIRLTEDAINDNVNYSPSQAYGQSKLANILMAKELDRKLKESNPNHKIYINCAHPGFVNAKGVLRGVKASKGKMAYYAGSIFMDLVALNIKQGALTQIYLAASPEIESKQIRSQYYGPIAEPYTLAPKANDELLAKKLWSFSENLIQKKLS